MKLTPNIGNGEPLTIEGVSRRTGCNVPTIRYYEEICLIPAASRRPSGHRVYDTSTVELLGLIKHSRELGVSIDDIRELISLAGPTRRPRSETHSIASAHLSAVRRKLQQLTRLEKGLAGFVESCSTERPGAPAIRYTILNDLAAPSRTRPNDRL